MKNTLLGLVFALMVALFLYREFSPAVSAEIEFHTENEYISKYRDAAILEMKIFKIPASITLAQALLESAAGKSDLATKANNHFGIKCKGDWWGETYYFTDDKPNECFRKYPSVSDSYRDHSVFLSGAKRYSALFKLDPCDYKGWAEGLQKAGYATDINYAKKLITKIELHNLAALDVSLK